MRLNLYETRLSFSGLIAMNGAVAAMLPVTVMVAVGTGLVPSGFAYLTGANLTLAGPDR